MSLFDALSLIAEQITQHRELMNKSEATVEQVSVMPFIDALGYDSQNPAEVRKQYAILNWDAVDFAVLRNNEPIMVIEAKKSSEALTKHWKQLFQYFNADKARVGILTNGIEYRFYIDSVKQNIMDDEPSLTINLENLDKVAVAQLDGFTKTRFHPEQSLRKVKISNMLARELQRPSDDFVRYVAKQIHSGTVRQTVIDEYRPIVKQCLYEFVKQKTKEPVQPKPIKGTKPVLPGASKVPVFGNFEGHRFEATLIVREHFRLQDKQNMRFSGTLMNHREAMLKAKRTINSSAKDDKSAWLFWHFLHPDTSKETPIRELFKNETLRNLILKRL